MNEPKLQITQLMYNYLLKDLLNRMSNSQHAYQFMDEHYSVVEPIPTTGDFELENDLYDRWSQLHQGVSANYIEHFVKRLETASQVPRVRNQRGPRYPVYFDEPHYTPEMDCIWRSGTTAQEWMEHRSVCKRALLKCLSREKE